MEAVTCHYGYQADYLAIKLAQQNIDFRFVSLEDRRGFRLYVNPGQHFESVEVSKSIDDLHCAERRLLSEMVYDDAQLSYNPNHLSRAS